MRVTQRMMVENMKYWLAKRSESLYRAETVNGSGKKVNSPSDDPVSAQQILRDRTTLSAYGQYQSNVSQALNWIEAVNDVYETAYDLLEQAQEIATNQSAGDLETRNELISTMTGIQDQVLDLANTRYGGSYLFSGDQTPTRPFASETTVVGGTAEDIVFELAETASLVEIQIFDQSRTLVRTMTVSGGVAGTNTVTWDGLDDGGLVVEDGVYQYTVSASDSSGGPVASCPTYRGGAASKVIIIGENSSISINNDGGDIFGPALMAISQALSSLEADPFDAADLAEKADILSEALSAFLMDMTDLATAGARLTRAEERMAQLYDAAETRIADLETAEANAAAIEVQTLETAYEVTLETLSQILSRPNLLSLL
ncbi:MAG: FlgD immunoglobulin-like domain containing protein [Thermodesulfobacteriota bacterium]